MQTKSLILTILLVVKSFTAIYKLYLIWKDNKEKTPLEKLQEGKTVLGAIIVLLEIFGLVENDLIYALELILDINDDKELITSLLKKLLKKKE